MGEFLKGWRRKAGLVTLALACLLMVLWFRSYVIADFITTGTSNYGHHIVSTGGGYVVWAHSSSDSLIGQSVRVSWLSRTYDGSQFAISEDSRITAQRTFLGAEFTTARTETMRRLSFWNVPFLLIVLPLTLLSAWLILGKRPKARNRPHQDTPS